MKLIKYISAILFCSLFSFGTVAGQNTQKIPLKYGAQYVGKRTDGAMQKFRENRFGQFIHWGLYAIPGGEWKGKMYSGAAEWLKASAKVPQSEWRELMKEFNPTDFNAEQWAKDAKKLGVKYMTITTKHHDGFCIWPSAYTDFNVSNSPYKKDIVGQLVSAYNKEGIDVYLYFSVMDWDHPDWKYDLKNKADSVAFDRFLEFSYNQLKELATNYPTVKGFWFDGTWDASMKKNGKWTYEVEKMLKETIPGCIVSSRLRADDFGKRGKDSNGLLMGDYESGYERKLPAVTDTNIVKVDWEACFTVPVNQWGYHKDWSLSHVKTSGEMLENIAHTISMGGNFLLNFGPMGNGDFRKEEKKMIEEIGGWMKTNGEAIYGCDHAYLQKQDWGYYTFNPKTNDYYMIVFNLPVYNALKVKLPKEKGIVSATALGKDASLTRVEHVDGQDFLVHFKSKSTNGLPFVFKIKIGGLVKGKKFEEPKV